MGLVQSIFCSMTFCVERVLTWTCCAFVLMLMMFTFIILMVYGVSVGYHYAQKELASFAVSSRTTTEAPVRRSGLESRPVVRMVAVNRSAEERAPRPVLEIYQTRTPSEKLFMESPETPIVLLETESPPMKPAMLPHEQNLARRLIGRFRRSRNITSVPFLRPLNSSEPTTLTVHLSR
ncbi:hypothetical protein ACJJTC_004789 [Scirpophaga incertulas]